MKKFFQNKWVIGGFVILLIVGLVWGGKALIELGETNALKLELEATNQAIANMPAGRSANSLTKLLAKRKALQDLLAQKEK